MVASSAEMFKLYRTSSIDWKPSPVIALATSADQSQVSAAREDGSLEIWLVSPGSVGWHHQLTIHGNPNSRVSSLVWCRTGSSGLPCGRLFSSSIDGTVSEWDLLDLKQKTVVESTGISIWQMALAPINSPVEPRCEHSGNGHITDKVNDTDDDDESSESEDDSDLKPALEKVCNEERCVAVACDDGAVRIYHISDSDGFTYYKSLPRVSGRALSVTWSLDASMIYSGSSDGLIRCWNVNLGHEVYRITVGLGGVGGGPELCVWSLLLLRCGTLVSGDSNGSVQFWNGDNGTLLHAHCNHKGDVNALAVAPSHNRVFSGGSDGQVILYKLSSEKVESSEESFSEMKWVYIGYVRAHTHDIRALTVTVPISHEGPLLDKELKKLQDGKGKHVKRLRRRRRPIDFSYSKWAHLGVPMLISAGDDAKLFAYSVKEFTKFSPHDICPAPQRVPIQLVLSTSVNQNSLLLAQAPYWLDILSPRIPDAKSSPYGGHVTTDLVARVKSKASRKIICSAISNSGELFAYSDHIRPSLFELSKKHGKSTLTINKLQLPHKLPYAHSMIFNSDSSRLMIAGHDRRIYVIDIDGSKLLYTFVPCRDEQDEDVQSNEPPITKMFTSSDSQWLAAVNCFGDVYIFNLEIQRQHWFISRLDGASVTAAGFPPLYNNVLIITTSSNQVYEFDVEAKQLGEWSMQHTFTLPKRYQDFPGEVIGLSFCPTSSPLARAPSVIIYSSRAMCSIDFGSPVDQNDEGELVNGQASALQRLQGPTNNAKRKHWTRDTDAKLRNFEFVAFRDPVLFIGHLSKHSVLKIDKPWGEVVNSFDAAPVHRHMYGS